MLNKQQTNRDDSPHPPLPPFRLLLRLSRRFLTLASGPLGFSALFLLKLSRFPSFTLAALLRCESLYAIFRLLIRCAKPDLDTVTPRSSTIDLRLLPLLPSSRRTLGCVCRLLPHHRFCTAGFRRSASWQ